MSRFQPGQSGNPKGRPPALKAEARAMFEALTPHAFTVLERILTDDNAKPAERLAAAQIVFERAYGKPPAGPVLTRDPEEDLFKAFDSMSEAELRIIAGVPATIL